MLARRRPAAIFTTGGYVAIPVLIAAAPLDIPVVLWEGNVIPGRAVRATARLADVLAVSFEATCQTLASAAPGRPCYVTGTPIRDTTGIDRVAARDAPRHRARRPGCCWSSAARRRSAGSTTRSPRRCRRSSSGRWSSTSPATTATPRRWPVASRCPRRSATATARSRSSATTCSSALAAADLVVGPGRLVDARRGHRPRAADRRRAVPARRRPPAGERPRRSWRPAPAGSSTTRPSMPRRCSTPRASSTIRPRTSRWRPRRARSVARAPPTPSPRSWSLAAAGRSPLPDAATIEPPSARSARMTRAAAAFDPIARRSRHRSAGSASRRRATSRWPASPRCGSGGPADLFATAHNALRAAGARALRAVARAAAHLSSAGAATSSSPIGACAASSSTSAPRAARIDGERLRRRGRRPDGAGRDRDAEGRPDRPRVRAGHPGHGRWRRLGQRRRARVGRRRRPRVGATSSSPTAARPCCRPTSSGWPTATAASSTRRGDGVRRARARRHVPARAGRPGGHQGAPRRHPALAAGPPAARPAVGGQRVPQPARRLGRPAHRGGRAQGLPDRRRDRVRQARQLHRQRPEGQRDRRAPARRPRPRRRGIRDRHRARLRDRVRRRLGGLAVAGRERRRPAAGRRALRRSVGRARRVDRVGHGDRGCPGRRRRGRPPGAHRPRWRLVVAAGRPPSRRPAGLRLRRSGLARGRRPRQRGGRHRPARRG